MSTTLFTSTYNTLITINPNADKTRHKHIVCSKDFWFTDGNIVLIASTATRSDRSIQSSTCSTLYAFKVHRGQLARHSEVFSDLFCIPQPTVTSGDEKILLQAFDECPWVEMPDDAEDLYWFLRALYDGLYFPIAPRVSPDIFPFLSSVLRLSNKYIIPHLRTLCLNRLATDFPRTLDGWDRREAAATYPSTMTMLEFEKSLMVPEDSRTPYREQDSEAESQAQCHPLAGQYRPRDFYPHPFLIIQLALEMGSGTLDYDLTTDMKQLLPSAFYDLSRYAPSRVAGWVSGKEKIIAGDQDVCAPVDPEQCEAEHAHQHEMKNEDEAPTSPSSSVYLSAPTSPSSPNSPIAGPMPTPLFPSSLQILPRILQGRELGQKFVAEWILSELVGRRPVPECIYPLTLNNSGRWVPTATEGVDRGSMGQARSSNPTAGLTSGNTQYAHLSPPGVSMSANPGLSVPNSHTSAHSAYVSSLTSPVGPIPFVPNVIAGATGIVGAGSIVAPVTGTTTSSSAATNTIPSVTTPTTNASPSTHPQPTHPVPSTLLSHPNSSSTQSQVQPSPVISNTSHSTASTSSPWGHPCTESFYFVALNLLRAVGGIAVGRDADPLFTIRQAEEMLGRCDFVEGGAVEDDVGEDNDATSGSGANAATAQAGIGATNAGSTPGDQEQGRSRKKRACALQICTPCKLSVKESCERARRRVWAEMPGWFGLK
ncbi:hypothetical protein VKT23_004947 [Stygiomarasmius scandens]|uniref:BTB domain-containing protein n=1 Tax=Marasmiellus scandens TaxID=2682957 RepID=A0ABR1JRP5_9AGAR